MTQAKEDVQKLATMVFGDIGKAKAWLTTPIKTLNYQTPTSKLENNEGIEEVRIILRKIESGEFT